MSVNPYAAWLTAAIAARALDLTPNRVRQLADEGRIRSIRTPLGRLLDPADVERMRVERKGKRDGRLFARRRSAR